MKSLILAFAFGLSGETLLAQQTGLDPFGTNQPISFQRVYSGTGVTDTYNGVSRNAYLKMWEDEISGNVVSRQRPRSFRAMALQSLACADSVQSDLDSILTESPNTFSLLQKVQADPTLALVVQRETRAPSRPEDKVTFGKVENRQYDTVFNIVLFRHSGEVAAGTEIGRLENVVGSSSCVQDSKNLFMTGLERHQFLTNEKSKELIVRQPEVRYSNLNIPGRIYQAVMGPRSLSYPLDQKLSYREQVVSDIPTFAEGAGRDVEIYFVRKDQMSSAERALALETAAATLLKALGR